MDKIYEQTLLLDIYGELLTEKQREICRLHLQEDLSLGEISEELGISRQGVSDAVHRAMHTLENTESKLHLRERFLGLCLQTERMQQMLESGASREDCLRQLQKLRDSIQIRS